MAKYSEVKELLKIDTSKIKGDGLAYFTHYLHTYNTSEGSIFKQQAELFFEERKEMLGINSKLTLDKLLPIQFDVPFPAKKSTKFTFIDLFAGIGGFRMAFQNLGGKCVFSSEWNKFAQITYEANYGEVPFGDITKIDADSIPDHDLLFGGFPCQPFSIAGVSKKNALGRAHGFEDETQGTLFFDIERIIKIKKPKAFILENVKNLRSHDKKRTFKVIEEHLKSLGYNLHVDVLNAKHYVPQHRERIFIVGFREDIFQREEKFVFPKRVDIPLTVKEILDPNIPEKYTLTDNLWKYLRDYAIKHKAKGNGFGFGLANPNGITRTLSARYYKDGSEILIDQGSGNPRRLSPTECAQLMGYPKNFIIPVSDGQAYKQFGNSVVTKLVEAIGKNLIPSLRNIKNTSTSNQNNSVSSKVANIL